MSRPYLRLGGSTCLRPVSIGVMLLLIASGVLASPLPMKSFPASIRDDSLSTATVSPPLYVAADSAVAFPPPLPANEAILAFELVSDDGFDSIQAQSMISSRPTFYIAYDNSTSQSSTFDRVRPSLPDLSLRQQDIAPDTISNVANLNQSQHIDAMPHRNGNTTLTYKLFFPDQFDFRRDARLPSMFSGRSQCFSCFSTRVRYNADGAGELYMYSSGGGLGASDALCTRPGSTCSPREIRIGRGTWTFARNRWITVRHDVWVNQGANSDGGFNLWIDGHLVSTDDAVRYTGTGGVCAGTSSPPVGNEMFDSCLPVPRARWAYSPAIRRVRAPQPTVTTRILVPTTFTAGPVTVTPAPVTVTHTDAVTVRTTETDRVTVPVTVPMPVTETATATITVTEAAPAEPTPVDPPAEDEPIDPPSEDAPEGDEPAEESVRSLSDRLAARDKADRKDRPRRDDGMWKGLNGYPGDPGYQAGQSPAVTGYPVTLTVQQVVTLFGPPVVTVTKTLPAGPTPKPKTPKKPKP